MSRLDWLNRLSAAEAQAEFFRCCGVKSWADGLAARRPFLSAEELFKVADRSWSTLGEREWLEAFVHHPRIGDLASLQSKFGATAQWASQEQGAVAQAPDQILRDLSEANNEYFEKFGFVFIVCATGKSATEMLTLLRNRIHHDRNLELKIAADEQSKITRIRLEKLLKP